MVTGGNSRDERSIVDPIYVIFTLTVSAIKFRIFPPFATIGRLCG